MEELFSVINHSNDVFWNGNAICLATYIASFTYLFSSKNKTGRANKSLAVFSILCITLFCYNPFLYRLLAERIPDSGEGVFGRIWIILPVWVTIAYVITEAVGSIKTSVYKNIACIVIVGCLMIIGSTVITSGYYSYTDSVYKVNNRGIEIADYILEHNGGNETGVLVFEYKHSGNNYDRNDELSFTITQYTGKIKVIPFFFDEQTYNDLFVEDIQPDGITQTADYLNDLLIQIRNKKDFEYVIMPHEEALPEKMMYCGYELVKSVGNKDIYVACSRWYIQSYSFDMEDNNKLYVLSDNSGHCVIVGSCSITDRKDIEKIISSYGKCIDAWIITCPSAENLEGFNKIVTTDGYSIGEVYIPAIDDEVYSAYNQDEGQLKEFIEISNKGTFKLHEVKADDEFEIYGMSFYILSDLLVLNTGDILDNSMLIKMEAGDKSVLFCSYIGFEQGQFAINKYGDSLQSDYVQIASGNGVGLSSDFYNVVNPEIALCDSIRDDAGLLTYDYLTSIDITCYCIENGSPSMVIIE